MFPKILGLVCHFGDVSQKFGWANAHPAHPIPRPLKMNIKIESFISKQNVMGVTPAAQLKTNVEWERETVIAMLTAILV